MKKILLGLTSLVVIVLFVVACNKDNAGAIAMNGSAKTPLVVYLTDGPLRLDTVNLDIKNVEVKLDTNASHMSDDRFGDDDLDSLNDRKHHDGFGIWDTLGFTPGVYNIAALRNGVDQSIATGSVVGTIRKIRLTLGTNNSIIQNGITYPLVVNSKYVYVSIKKKHHQKDSVNTSATALRIDVDLFRSIKLVNGTYYFLPYLKPFNDSDFAKLSGIVLPADAKPLVTVYSTTDTAYAIPERNGYYKVRGLTAGTYSINFKAMNGYKDTTISNIVLNLGQETKAPSIVLHK
jgi:hypothetical protein